MRIERPEIFALAADFIRWKIEQEQYERDLESSRFVVKMKWGSSRKSAWTGHYDYLFQTAFARISKNNRRWVETKDGFPYTLRRKYRGFQGTKLTMNDLQDVMVYIASHEVAHHLQWRKLLGNRFLWGSKEFKRMREPQADEVAFKWTEEFQRRREESAAIGDTE